MSQDLLQLLGTIAAAFIGFVGIYLSVRQTSHQSKTDAAQGLFNELQEERNELKREREELRGRLDRCELELRQVRIRELQRDEYLQDLRNHIRLELPPPPPPWPEHLRDS